MLGRSVDLHMHSCYSNDGEFSPEELVDRCIDGGIRIMAIADHNSARANVRGTAAARQAGIVYIPAIEIDCTFKDVNLHVLGYGIDYGSSDFTEIEDNVSRQAAAASRQMLCAVRELGFHVTEEDMERLVSSGGRQGGPAEDRTREGGWTGEMFAEVLLGKTEYEDHPLLRPYRAGGDRGDNPYVNFYWDYYSQGKPCYVKIEYPSLEQTVEVIHGNRGYAVLAHPGMNLKGRSEMLKPVIESGLDGIEAFSSYHSPEQALYFYDAVKRNGLFFTCGSDYHGKTKPSICVGGHGCVAEDEEVVRQLDQILQ